MLLVVARVEGEGDDVGDRVDGEAREDHSGARRREAHSVRLLVGREAAGRAHLAEVRVSIYDSRYVCFPGCVVARSRLLDGVVVPSSPLDRARTAAMH